MCVQGDLQHHLLAEGLALYLSSQCHRDFTAWVKVNSMLTFRSYHQSFDLYLLPAWVLPQCLPTFSFQPSYVSLRFLCFHLKGIARNKFHGNTIQLINNYMRYPYMSFLWLQIYLGP